MKKAFRLLVATVIFGMLVVGCACTGVSDFTIKVSGTSGLEFSGHYIVVTRGGLGSQTTVEHVDGVVPAVYEATGDYVLCRFEKGFEYGILRVEIVKGGEVISQSETSAAYGVVSVDTD